ncbi:MAG: LPS assembly protein LptD, partial [Mariprofundaceae bacterium]
GNVEMQSSEGRIVAESAEVNSDTHAGNIEQATVYLPDGERLQAAKVTRINDSLFEAHDARFSSCPAGDEAWALQAESVRLDQREGELSARGASFEVGGVPVLYSPWWLQTLKRKSGLLTPKVGTGKRRGTELGIPWYFAPADNWDATLTPTWMSARGVMGEAEVRHVSRLGHERINVAGINDAVTGSTRSRLQSDIAWHLPKGIELAIRADHVSDHLYLADYAAGSDASTRYLQSTATLSQAYISDSFNSDWMLTGQHQQDMTLASNATTLQILPRLESRMQWQALEHAYLHMDQQTTRFARATGQDGWRMDLHPYVEVPWQLAGGGLSASLQVGSHFTRYWLQAGALNASRQRTTGEASFELRSDFERISADTTWRHQISPVLRYDYISASDQTNMANFDSTFGRLTWSNLLTGNRFTGRDRIEKINRISLMLETRLQHKDGLAARELLLFRAGAAYDMLRQSVDPALQAAATRPFSNLLAELTLTPMQGLRLFASGQYNPADRYWSTLTSSLDIAAGRVNFHAGYQLTDARYALESQLLDLSATLRLGQRWQASGRWQYDNLLKLTQQTTLGLKYSHPCWSLGVEGYRLNRPNGTAQSSDFGARILLEFKGLGSVGSS